MNIYSKVFLTISYLVGLAYLVTFYCIDLFRWITNNLIPFEYQNIFVSIIYYPAMFYLIYRIWTFKNIAKKTKGNWTVLLLFLNIVTMPIYIWRTDDMFVKQNDEEKG